MIITLSNVLSFCRAPLALLFLQESSQLRLLAIFLAMLTDSIDGYLARRSQSASLFGAILDPVMDKFFVFFALGIFYLEGKITPFAMGAMLSRDFFVFLYGLFMVAWKKSTQIQFRSIRWGKVSTALQFIVLMGLTVELVFPREFFILFIAMGLLAFWELLQVHNPFSTRSNI